MLTPLSKILIGLAVVGVIGGGLWYLNSNPSVAEKVAPGLTKSKSTATTNTSTSGSTTPVAQRTASNDILVVGMNTWGGQAAGVYMNNGQKASSTSSKFFTMFNQQVQIEVTDDFLASREALKNGAIDVLCFATVGEFSIEAAGLSSDGIKIYCHYDKSWGGDALVVREGINSIADLVGKTIALAPGSPSHGLFLNLIRVSGYTQNQFKIKEVKDGLDAADVFRKEQVDAAFVWSPDDSKLPHDVRGAKVLVSTKTAENIIWDCMLVKQATAASKHEAIKNFIAGWLYGSAAINTNKEARAEAVEGMVTVFGLPKEDWSNLTIAKFMTLGDNLNFFGLNSSYRDVTGEELYSRMGDEYKNLKLADGSALVSGNPPSWREVADPVFINELRNDPRLVQHQTAEVPKVFAAPTPEIANAPAVTTNRVTVEYESGSAELSYEAKRTIKQQFGVLARGFTNAYIRVEGNTDNVGSASLNRALSLRRAESVKAFLVMTYGWQSNKIIVKGNGFDEQIAETLYGLSNDSPEGRAKNRRTEFEIVVSR